MRLRRLIEAPPGPNTEGDASTIPLAQWPAWQQSERQSKVTDRKAACRHRQLLAGLYRTSRVGTHALEHGSARPATLVSKVTGSHNGPRDDPFALTGGAVMERPVTTGADADQPRAVEAGRGLTWWTDAWALFTKNAAIWIVQGLILLVILIVLGFIPLIGLIATSLLVPILAGGWMMAANKVEGGGTLEVADLFGAFKGDKLTPLTVLGALFLAMMVAIFVVIGVLGFGGALGMVTGGASHSMKGMMAGMGVGLLAVLAGLLLGVLATMAMWFAVPLVALRGVAPVDALRQSFAASAKNVVPFLVWGVIYFVAAIIASIPFGLGWIVLGPVLMLTAYVSYKDVFGT